MWKARRWSVEKILWAQAAVSVAQAVAIVLFVMKERRWQQQENQQRQQAQTKQSAASPNPAVASQSTASETVALPSRGAPWNPSQQKTIPLRQSSRAVERQDLDWPLSGQATQRVFFFQMSNQPYASTPNYTCSRKVFPDIGYWPGKPGNLFRRSWSHFRAEENRSQVPHGKKRAVTFHTRGLPGRKQGAHASGLRFSASRRKLRATKSTVRRQPGKLVERRFGRKGVLDNGNSRQNSPWR